MLSPGAIGGLLGLGSGLTSPSIPKYDYKKEGVGFLTGYGKDRISAFKPLLNKMSGIAMNGGQMSAQDRLKFAAGELANLGGSIQAMHQGVNERSIQRGVGAGDGMAEAGHLQVGMAGLDARRKLLGGVAAQEAGNKVGNQMNAFSQLASLYNSENRGENEQIGMQFQNRVDRKMQGSRLHRGINGAWQGYSAMG